MAIQFRPDVVSAMPQQDALTKKTKSPQNNSPDEKVDTTVTVQYTRTEVYNLHGKLQMSEDDSGSLLDSYLETKKVIREQLALLSGSDASGAPEVDEGEAAAVDGIPEYWNKENTARRIFSIAMMGYTEGMDREEFANKAIEMVKQAYSDVGATLGFEFPQLVTDTRQAVLGALEQFKGGAALSEISFQ
ncbi:MAG: hypothetical protein JSU77_07275 [Fidelibacterota bacterium]|nr:MAG: hypothetical protein JSU77_07275 [Candidatus Neomarinimicrobiota bacterium]